MLLEDKQRTLVLSGKRFDVSLLFFFNGIFSLSVCNIVLFVKLFQTREGKTMWISIFSCNVMWIYISKWRKKEEGGFGISLELIFQLASFKESLYCNILFLGMVWSAKKEDKKHIQLSLAEISTPKELKVIHIFMGVTSFR